MEVGRPVTGALFRSARMLVGPPLADRCRLAKPMLTHQTIPAQQLHSVCQRYTGAWQRALDRAGQWPWGSPLCGVSPAPAAAAAEAPPAAGDLARLEAILFLAREPLTS